MFDVVSYQKGGRILNMLRIYLGDDAFFKSLNLYLTTYKYSNGNADKLRLSFEAVTGKDLQWFFNQWYYGSGHPILDIKYKYNPNSKLATVFIEQKQMDSNIFKLPMFIDVYAGNTYKRYPVFIENKLDSFNFEANQKPDLINVDAEKFTLCAKMDNKELKEYIFQFKHARNYLDRKEALDVITKNMKDSICKQIVIDALEDSFFAIKMLALKSFKPSNLDAKVLKKLPSIIQSKGFYKFRELAIDLLAQQKDSSHKQLFIKYLNDSSYTISGAALSALELIDSTKAYEFAKKIMHQKNKKRLASSVNTILIKYGTDDVVGYILDKYEELISLSEEKFSLTAELVPLLIKIKNEVPFKRGIDLIVKFRNAIPQAYRKQTDPYINMSILEGIKIGKVKLGEIKMVEYIEQAIK